MANNKNPKSDELFDAREAFAAHKWQEHESGGGEPIAADGVSPGCATCKKLASKAKMSLTKEANAFINHGTVTYKNGPWDNEAMQAMQVHGSIADALRHGSLTHPPVCKDCGKVVVPSGVSSRGLTWTHMGTPVTQVRTSDSGNPLARVTGGTSLADTVDNENHEAAPAAPDTAPTTNPNLGRQFRKK